MILLILRLFIAALLVLPGVAAEEATAGLEGGVTEEYCIDNPDECDPQTPSELPGPGE